MSRRARNIKPGYHARQEDVLVDIVTPVYGSPNFLSTLIESMLSNDAGVKWSWTLVDDLGPDREQVDAIYASIKDPRIRIIRNARNCGFAMSNNAGFRKSKAPLILTLNSDIFVMQDNWLKVMTDEFFVGPDCVYTGVVGARLLFFNETTHNFVKDEVKRPAGKVQHAGVAFNMLGQPYHIFMGWSKDHPKVATRREMNAVTGACLLTRRDIYEKLGGLDREYTTGNFEDVQYCLQVRQMGGKVIYQPEACLQHYGGGSGNTETAIYNASLFQMKCRKIIEYDDWKYW